jgi:hypothetical protein
MHSFAFVLLASLAAIASAACDRDDLKDLAVQYVDAQATGSIDDMPPFIDVATVSIPQIILAYLALLIWHFCFLDVILGSRLYRDINQALGIAWSLINKTRTKR